MNGPNPIVRITSSAPAQRGSRPPIRRTTSSTASSRIAEVTVSAPAFAVKARPAGKKYTEASNKRERVENSLSGTMAMQRTATSTPSAAVSAPDCRRVTTTRKAISARSKATPTRTRARSSRRSRTSPGDGTSARATKSGRAPSMMRSAPPAALSRAGAKAKPSVTSSVGSCCASPRVRRSAGGAA